MPKYILCPRCELNYILDTENYCDVCKAEMKIGPQLMFSANEDSSEQVLCPVCKQRYISEDEEMCEQCREEQEYKREKLGDDIELEDGDEWRRYLDDDEKDVISSKGDEDEMVSLSQIEEEEALDDLDEEDDIDPYTNEKIGKKSDDDFVDDDFDYSDIDEKDFEDDEEDEEDDEDEDDE